MTMMMRKIAAPCFILLAAFAAHGQGREAAGAEVVDRMVAVVNGDLITHSDLLWQLALEPDTPLDSPRSEDLQRALERLIEQRLLFVEAHKLPHIEPKGEEVERALAELARRFASQAELQARLARVGLTAERLREIVSERVEIEKYIEFRFGSFTIITSQDVADYYRRSYVPRFRQRSPGRIVPKLEEVSAEIEKTLREDKVATDLTDYLDESRRGAEITILNRP